MRNLDELDIVFQKLETLEDQKEKRRLRNYVQKLQRAM